MENLKSDKVLLVEEDQKLAGLMAHFLSRHGFEIQLVHRGDLALEAFLGFRPKIVILDLMLPGQRNFHVCREIRKVSNARILILTAKDCDRDHVLGLECGADDYVVKPIKPLVLLARIRALQRRSISKPTVFRALAFGMLSIDRGCRTVSLGDDKVNLTSMEFELLWLLAVCAGETLSRNDILNRTRGISFDGNNRSIDVGISKLRGKLNDKAKGTVCIKTIWGKGYMFNPFAWEV